MAIDSLKDLSVERGLHTDGRDFQSHIASLADLDKINRPDCAVLTQCLQRVFGINKLDNSTSLTFWSDKMEGLGSEHNFYTDWSGVFILGVFYSQDAYGADKLSHIFVRDLHGFKGPLDEWNLDIQYPVETRRYSVCVVFPGDYERCVDEERDPHNYTVSKFTTNGDVNLDFNCIRNLVVNNG